MKNFLSIIFVFTYLISFSQLEDRETKKNQKSEVSLNAGYGFSAISNEFTLNNFYLQPYINKPIKNKLSLQAGMVFQNINFGGINNEYSLMPRNLNTISYFAQGSIQQTENLILFGGINHTRELNFSNFNNSSFNSNRVYGGFEYKLNKNTSIGAAISYSQGNNSIFNQSSLLSPRNNTTNNFSPFLW